MLVENHVIEPAVFRREAWERAGGYRDSFPVPGIEDWDLWLRIMALGYRVEVIPQIIWEYRIRPGTMSAAMLQPANWEPLIRELARQQASISAAYAAELVGKWAARWAKLREWVLNREAATQWWRRQAGNWQRIAAGWEQLCAEQQADISRLRKQADESTPGNLDPAAHSPSATPPSLGGPRHGGH
jgi:hypothetical protein